MGSYHSHIDNLNVHNIYVTVFSKKEKNVSVGSGIFQLLSCYFIAIVMTSSKYDIYQQSKLKFSFCLVCESLSQ